MSGRRQTGVRVQNLITYHLEGKRAIVTGGASGIGLGTVERFARSGATVAMMDLPGNPRLESEAQRLRAEGLKVLAVPANVGQKDALERAMDSAIKKLGGLDYLVNNAGTPGTRKPIPLAELDALTEEFWTKILSINLLGAFWATRAAADSLRKAGGTVVNTVSDSAFGGGASSLAYACAKTALVRMTQLLAKSLAPDIRVNGIAPGFVNSNWECSFGDIDAAAERTVPLKRVGQPADYAEAIVFLAVGARYMTGETVLMNGGSRL